MNAITGAPFVGASAASGDFTNQNPLTIETKAMMEANMEAGERIAENVLFSMSKEHIDKLRTYLVDRLKGGVSSRNRRARRYGKIDRLISTWQRLDPAESKRAETEDTTGKAMALPMNLPVLATHLADMASYYTEALAPISNPFFSASGENAVQELLKKLNRDALARDYYTQLSSTMRSLLKYNIGGLWVDWDGSVEKGAGQSQVYGMAAPGNCWRSADPYNTLWDTAIKNPTDISHKAEWAASVCVENRLTLMRKALAGEWYGLNEFLSNVTADSAVSSMNFYCESAKQALINDDGSDAKTASGSTAMNWNNYGLGLSNDSVTDVGGFEQIDMYCWLVPAQFGLLTDAERKQIQSSGKNPDAFLELWRFTLIGDNYLVNAQPVLDRVAHADEVNIIPLFMSYMTQDQLKEAQRSAMEFMAGFQRFASTMYNMYIAGMRKNIWGAKGVDTTMFDIKPLKDGDTAGILESKQPGRDVRSGLMALDQTTGVEKTMDAVESALAMKDKFFPSQALPSQIAGIDRAVSSQVAMVMQGGTRALRATLRLIDSTLLNPSRLAAYRNIKRFDPEGVNDLTDEDIAKLLGSGIESMEAERITEAMWKLLYAVIQNQESMQTFNVPLILSYIGRISNLNIELGQFARQPAPPATPPPGPGAPGAAPPPPASAA